MTAKTVMVALLLGVAGIINGYTQSFTVGDLKYSINSDGISVTLTRHVDGEGAIGELVIPEAVTYEGTSYPVTAIGNSAFYNCSGLTGDLVISNSVTTIGYEAFSYCYNFTGELVIPNSVTTIGESAFSYCSFTGNLIIPNSVTGIGVGAFAFAGFDGELVLSDAMTIIQENAFQGCGFTGELTIPNTITRIQGGAFSGAGFSGGLSLPNSITHIGYDAFSFCGFTGCLEIPNSVIEIGERAFCWCDGISCITIPNTVGLIGGEAFQNTGWYNNQPDGMLYLDGWCLGYKEIQPVGTLTFQENTIGIAGGAFFNCTELTGILTIPESIRSIGGSAFYGCTGLTELHFNAVEFNYVSGNPFMECGGLTTLVIGNSVESIPDYIFSDAGFTGNLIIPNSVTSIGKGAFQGCNGFTGELVIPNSVTSIGSGAFYSCNGFSGGLIIPNSVTMIGGYAFYDCNSLTSITIPNSVTMIGEYAFAYCSSIEDVVVEENNPVYDSRDDCNAIIMTSANELVFGCKNTVVINSVVSIGRGAFSGCSGLIDNLIIPNSVTTIGSAAFYNCTGLITITMSNSVITIGNNAFSGCINLMGRMTIPQSVASLGGGAFNGCKNLTEIEILGSNPPSLGIVCFNNTSCPLYVPYESLNAYKTATNWTTYESRIYPMSYNTIPSYSSETDNWCFIASPLVEEIAPTAVEDMITNSSYDLYQFNQSESAEWQNYKANNFNLTNGQGYLYANAEDVNIIFKGNFNEDDTKEVSLAYYANATFAGWNLVGNPFPVSAYANRSYYVMNEDGTAIEPVAVSMETAIPVCTGVMVKAESPGETVTFSKTASRGQDDQGFLQIAVAQNNTRGNVMQDKAIVSFSLGDRLEKYIFNKDNAQLYIPQGGKDYAIACVGNESEMPINFKAVKNGNYTISVNPEALEMDYLHLVDNLTGNDIDLLATPNYTFEAKTSDYASRFRLVFSSVCEDADGDDNFAFFSNGNFVINNEGQATLQVVDVTGRIVKSETINGCANVKVDAATGVYMLRLVNGENVKVQKVVAR